MQTPHRNQLPHHSQKPPRPRPSPPAGQWIGIAVLFLGVCALLGAGYAAYTLLWQQSGPTAQDPSNSGQESAATQDLAPGPPQNPASLAGVQEATFPVETDFQGVWEASFTGGQSAVIAFDKGRYQMIIAENPALPKRLYVRGAYSYTPGSGAMDLQPDFADLPKAPPGLIYAPLTRRAYTILLSFNPESNRLFLKPRVEGGANDQVHPLFFFANAGEALTGWSRRSSAPKKGG